MLSTIPSYVEAISEGFPTVQVSSLGSDTDYDALVWNAGDPLPTKAALDAVILTQTKTNMWRLIQAEREERSQRGGFKVGTNWFHSDQASRTQQIALVILGANLPAGVMWKTMAGTFVSMTPTLAGQIFQSAVGSDQAVFGRAEFHRASMMASTNPSAYNFSGGWPQSYEESLVV